MFSHGHPALAVWCLGHQQWRTVDVCGYTRVRNGRPHWVRRHLRCHPTC